MNLPWILGGKKLFYPQIHLPLIAIDELRAHVEQDRRFEALADICEADNNP